MYLKLAIRNAKRSVIDYLLYIATTIILLSIIFVSNYISIWGNLRANFQTASLPLLIVLIMTFLMAYINNFMVKQRSKEFATYLLLGMKKTTLFFMFACEIVLVGIICFAIGGLFSLLLYNLCFTFFQEGNVNQLSIEIIGKGTLYSFAYFCLIEICVMFQIRKSVWRLEISQLIKEKHRNQPLNERRKTFWICLFAISIAILWLMLCAIVALPDDKGFHFISVISLPVLCAIFSFYKWIYAFLSYIRIKSSEHLYEGNRLYMIAEITSGTRTNSIINAIFSMCLLFSAISFMFGTLLQNKNIHIYPAIEQRWMAFLQISICIIFIVIFFSILSLLQIIELKRQAENIRVLHYMGKSQTALKKLIRNQISAKLLIPTLMCFVILFSAAPAINLKLNDWLAAPMYNDLLKAFAIYILCFAVFYLCYFCITYLISRHYIKTLTQ